MRTAKGRLKAICGAFHLNSLPVIIAAVTVGISLASVLMITGVIYRHADSTINQSIQRSSAQIVGNVADSIGSYIGEMVTISDTVVDLLSRNSADKLGESLVVFLREDIETIAVFDTGGRMMFCTDGRSLREDVRVTREPWFAAASGGDARYTVSDPHVQRLFRGEYPWVITLTRGVSWMQEGEIRQGVVLVDMNFSRIKDLCARNLQNDGYIYIANTDGKIIYHPRQQMIHAGILPEEITLTAELNEGDTVVGGAAEKLAVSVGALPDTAWRIIGVTPMNGFRTYDKGPGDFLRTAICILAVVLLVSSLAVSGYIVRPLHRLMALMGRMSGGEVALCAPEDGIYEVGRLGGSFNRMVAQIGKLMEQVRGEQEQLRRSEIKTLYTQINPHFLYNTLDSVVWLAESGEQKNVVRMVMALAKYFRLSLSGARDFITVEEELQQVENYLIIQKLRFVGSFTYHIHCEESVCRAQTPKILLQPIVENAIIHGVGTMEEDGRIDIRAFAEDGGLTMEVRDNGSGIRPEVLARILEKDTRSSSGIGLKNVHQRIRLSCGNEYGLSLESEMDEGTAVRVKLPLKFGQPEKEAGV